MKKRIYWILGALGMMTVIGAVTLTILGKHYLRDLEPKVKQYTIEYLQNRFDSEVELAGLQVHFGKIPPISAFWNKGRGVGAVLEGQGLVMRHRGRRDLPPMFAIDSFKGVFDLGTLLESPRRVPHVVVTGMKINVPPKGERPDLKGDQDNEEKSEETASNKKSAVVGEVEIHDATLTLLPKLESKKRPLVFDIADLHLHEAGPGQAMPYKARLTNPKPKGVIESEGTFGPWNAEEPGASPLAGNYDFRDADLGVFKGIAGILQSKGKFHGELSSVAATGHASVPDFRLKRAGNPVPLTTDFEVDVDGTNGNTILKPVNAVLGTTKFRTEGAVIKHEKGAPRAIDLVADMPAGNLRDLMRLAMKGEPMMDGVIHLRAKIQVPPLDGKVREKLILDGTFTVDKGMFNRDQVQDKVDELSRRAQGQPKNMDISDTFSAMRGEFHMEDEAIAFQALTFDVPGATVKLTGNYDLDADMLNFLGTAAMDAKVSQMMSGWKRWLAKPIDPLFSKNGAGVYVGISVKGSAKKPDFGVSRNTKDAEQALSARTVQKPPVE